MAAFGNRLILIAWPGLVHRADGAYACLMLINAPLLRPVGTPTPVLGRELTDQPTRGAGAGRVFRQALQVGQDLSLNGADDGAYTILMEGYAERSCRPGVTAACTVTGHDLASALTGGEYGLQNWLADSFMVGSRINAGDNDNPSLSIPLMSLLAPQASNT